VFLKKKAGVSKVGGKTDAGGIVRRKGVVAVEEKTTGEGEIHKLERSGPKEKREVSMRGSLTGQSDSTRGKEKSGKRERVKKDKKRHQKATKVRVPIFFVWLGCGEEPMLKRGSAGPTGQKDKTRGQSRRRRTTAGREKKNRKKANRNFFQKKKTESLDCLQFEKPRKKKKQEGGREKGKRFFAAGT